MTFCPFCGVRADIDLRQVHFRDMGPDPGMACPQCTTPLDVIEFETEPRLQVERCLTCHGMFFNPGEIEALLDAQTNPVVWLDPVQLEQIAGDFGNTQREIAYQKCPMCEDRMTHFNFGGRSGVIADRCGTQGVWLEGGELRRLAEWWRAGGKLIYQQKEQERVNKLYSSSTPRGSISYPYVPGDGNAVDPGAIFGAIDLLDLLVSLVSSAVKR
jgi:Zn-finger nucleic acid-binding protein